MAGPGRATPIPLPGMSGPRELYLFSGASGLRQGGMCVPMRPEADNPTRPERGGTRNAVPCQIVEQRQTYTNVDAVQEVILERIIVHIIGHRGWDDHPGIAARHWSCCRLRRARTGCPPGSATRRCASRAPSSSTVDRFAANSFAVRSGAAIAHRPAGRLELTACALAGSDRVASPAECGCRPGRIGRRGRSGTSFARIRLYPCVFLVRSSSWRWFCARWTPSRCSAP